jgi:hypothetical protein
MCQRTEIDLRTTVFLNHRNDTPGLTQFDFVGRRISLRLLRNEKAAA